MKNIIILLGLAAIMAVVTGCAVPCQNAYQPVAHHDYKGETR